MKNIFMKIFTVIIICILLTGNLYVGAQSVTLEEVYCIDRDGGHSKIFLADAVCINAAFNALLPENAEAKLFMCEDGEEIQFDVKCTVSSKNLLIYPERVLKGGADYKIKFVKINVPDFNFKSVLENEDTYFYTDFKDKKMMSLYQNGGTFTTEKRESILRGKIAEGIKTNPYIDFTPSGIENEDNYVIDMKIKVNTLGSGVKIQLFDGKDSAGNWRVGNYIHSNGNIYTRDHLVSPYVNLGKYEKGEWLTYAVAYDIKNSVSRVYINGKAVQTDIPLFGAERPSLFRIDVKNETGAVGDIEIDYVRIYGGNAPVGENSSGTSPFFYKWEFDKAESNVKTEQMEGFWGFEQNCVLSGKAEKGVKSGACADAVTYSVENAQKYVVDTRIKVNTLQNGATVQLFDAKNENAEWRVGNYIHSNGSIYTRDSSISPAREVGKYEKGKWLRYSVIYDIPSKTSNVYINGVLTGKNIPLYGAENVTCFRIDLITSGGESKADVEFDYVKIYSGDTLLEFSKQLYSYDSIMEGEMEVLHTIGDGMAFSLVSDYYIKDRVRQKYSAEQLKPFLKDGNVYFTKEGAKEILGINTSESISAENAAAYIGLECRYDDRGFVILSENTDKYANSPVASVIFENADILYRSLVFDNPRGEKMLHILNKNMKGVHPRILYTKEETDFIREKCTSDERWKEALRKIESSAVSFLNIEKHFKGDCQPADKQNMARTFQEAIYALARAYLLTEKEVYAKTAEKYMNTMAMWDSMSSDVSNLVVGHWSMAMAIGYDSFYNYFSKTADGRKTLENIKNASDNAVVSAISSSYRGGDWTNRWMRINDNFSGVCSGGVMALCLALADEEDLRDDLIILLENLMKTQQIAVSLYYPDGGYYEGVNYGIYSLENLCLSIEAMFKCFNSDFGLGRAKGFDKAGEFFTHAQSGRDSFNFHDCAEGYVYTSLPTWFYYRYGNAEGASAHSKALKTYGFLPDINSLYYLDGTDDEKDERLDRYFRFTEVGTFRNSFDVKNQVYAAFHGGFTGLKHDMLDAGEFVFESDGVKWARDLGKDSYSIPGYFTNDGYKIYRKKTEGENCVVINPQNDASNYFGQKIGGYAQLLYFESMPSAAMAAYDLTDLYSRDVESYKRGYYFGDNRNTFTVRDEIVLKSSSEVYWFMNTEADIHISGKNVTLIKGDKKLHVKIKCSEEKFGVLSLPCTQLDEGMKVSGQRDDSALSKLAIYCPEAMGDVTISVKLIPEGAEYKDYEMPEGTIDTWTLPLEERKDNFYITDITFDEASFLNATVCFPENTKSAEISIGNKTYTFENCASVREEISVDAFKDLSEGVYKGTLTAYMADKSEQSTSFGLYIPDKKTEKFYENSLKNWAGEDIFTDRQWHLYSIGAVENNGEFALVFGSGTESDLGFRSKGRNNSYAFKEGSAVVDFDVKFSSDRGDFFFECMNTDKMWFMHTDKIITDGRDSGNRDYYADTWYNIKTVFNFDEQKITVYMKENSEENYRCIFRNVDKKAYSLLDLKLRYHSEFEGEKAYFKNFSVTKVMSDEMDMDFEIDIHTLCDGDIITENSVDLSAYVPFPEDGVKFILDGKEISSEKKGNIYTAKAENILLGLHRFTVISGDKIKTVRFTRMNFADEKLIGNNITQKDGVDYIDGFAVTNANVAKCTGADGEADGGLSMSPKDSSANTYIAIGTNYQYDINRAVIFETDFRRVGNVTFQLECTVNNRTNGKWIYLTEGDIVNRTTQSICQTDETVGFGEGESWHNIRIVQQLKSNGAKYYVFYDGRLIKEGIAADSEGGEAMRFASVKINLAKFSTGAIEIDNTRWGYMANPFFICAGYKKNASDEKFTLAESGIISGVSKQIKITQANNILSADGVNVTVNGISATAVIDESDKNSLIITPQKGAINPGEDVVIKVGEKITVLKADEESYENLGDMKILSYGNSAEAVFTIPEINMDDSIAGKKIMLVIASYNGEKMCAVNILRTEIKKDVFEYGVSLDNINGAKYIKAMVWNATNLSPVIKSTETK